MPAFLFTDIESSTRLWEEHPTEMAAALERHDDIMRSAIADAGGQLLKTTGDGAIAVFDTAPDAMRASIAAQDALQAEMWNTTPVRVRMGIHAGDTLSRDGDHFGPVMNRTARIMAAGHGGQVLLSVVAVSLTAGGMPDDTPLRDLGTHRLKDLTEPEHLYQLVHPDLSADFPALKTLDSRPNNLPLQTTEFLGRTQELAAIRLMLDNPATRLLTIAGPGGAGKTRLGLQIAADLADGFRDGVWFVDLSADTTANDAFETIVRTLALPASRTGAPLDVLETRLRDKELLLVLDNFEQVVEAGPGVVELLRAAPGVKVVITSRETLRVRGEQVYPVPSLTLPNPSAGVDEIGESEAVQLFIERANAARHSFTLDETNATDVAAICLRLDGLPLAIELAAARLTVFTPAQLLARLTQRLDVLASGGRDLPDRQRTLWGAIGWSYELLDQDECSLFELFSVFAGADVEALEAVAQGALDGVMVIDVLASLVDKSLVRRVETPTGLRFVMLQMIKEYAAERLAEDPERGSDAIVAHAGHYASMATERSGDLDHLEADLDNLRSAWDHWVAQGDVERLSAMFDGLWNLHLARGWYHGAIELAADLLGALQQSEPSPERDTAELATRVRHARALMAVHGYNDDVEHAFSSALELAEAVGTVEDQMPMLRALASYHLQSRNIPASMAIGQQLLEAGQALDDLAVQIDAHTVIGSCLLYIEALSAIEHYQFVIDNYDPAVHSAGHRLGPDAGVVARIGSAMMLWETGKLDSAAARATDARNFAASLDHPYSMTWALYHVAFLNVLRRRFPDVLATARELAIISDEHDYLLWRTLATVLEGIARTGLGELEEGPKLTERGVDLYVGLAPPPMFWPLVLMLRADVHTMAGNTRRAMELIDEAMANWEPMGIIPPDLAMRRSNLVATVSGPDTPEAEGLLEQAIATAGQLGMRLAELKAHTQLVALRRQLGKAPDGSADLAALLATFDEGHEEADYLAAVEVLRTG